MDSKLAQSGIQTPITGGIFKDESTSSNTLISLSVPDPDNDTNCYSWSASEDDWVMPQSIFKASAAQIKGALHLGMYRPTSPKEAKKTAESCIKYVGKNSMAFQRKTCHPCQSESTKTW